MKDKLNEYTNHTGGAYGVDTYGCLIGMYYGFNNMTISSYLRNSETKESNLLF